MNVHDAYVHVYSHGTSLVTDLIVERPNDLDDRLEKIRASFREKAAEFEGKRSALRGQADAFIRVFGEGSAERAFIWSVIEYFLRNDSSGQSVTDILKEADYIAEVGYHTALRSPISRTFQVLTSEKEPEKILAALNGERTALSARFTDAARCYHTARIQLLGLR